VSFGIRPRAEGLSWPGLLARWCERPPLAFLRQTDLRAARCWR